MASKDRRAAARRRMWGRGPTILRFEPLENRVVMSTTSVSGAGGALGSSGSSSTGKPDLAAVVMSTSETVDWGQDLRIVGDLQNFGTGAVSQDFLVDVYASIATTSKTTAVKLGAIAITEPMGPQDVVHFDQLLTMPARPPVGTVEGQPLTISLVIDPNDRIIESQENNNRGQGLGIDMASVAIAPAAKAQLVPVTFKVLPEQARWGQPLSITTRIQNPTSAAAPATRARIVLTPSGSELGSVQDITISELSLPAMEPGDIRDVQQTFNLPSDPPDSLKTSSLFTVNLVLDADHALNPVVPSPTLGQWGVDRAALRIQPLQTVSDTNANTNTNGAASTTSAASATSTSTASAAPRATANLQVSQVQTASTSAVWGDPVQVVLGLANTGSLPSGPIRLEFLLADPNQPNSAGLFLAHTVIDNLEPGFGQNVIQTVQLPNRLSDGSFATQNADAVIAVRVDPENRIYESNESDNLGISNPLLITLTPQPSNAVDPRSLLRTPVAGTTTTAATSNTATAGANSPTSATSSTTANASATTTPAKAAEIAKNARAERLRTLRANRDQNNALHPRGPMSQAAPPNANAARANAIRQRNLNGAQLRIFPGQTSPAPTATATTTTTTTAPPVENTTPTTPPVVATASAFATVAATPTGNAGSSTTNANAESPTPAITTTDSQPQPTPETAATATPSTEPATPSTEPATSSTEPATDGTAVTTVTTNPPAGE